MTIEEIKSFFEENKDSEEVKQYLSSFSKTPSVDEIMKNPEVLKFVDQKVSLGINTFKEKTLPGLVEQEKKKLQAELNPTDTPEMQRIKELEKMLAERDKQSAYANRKSTVTKTLADKQLPAELADYLIGETDEETQNRVTVATEALDKYMTKLREEIMKGHGTTVPKDKELPANAGEPGPNATKEQWAAWTRAQMRAGK